ncbi:MAG TPA: 5'-nucleotidase C-terminal domain-containing protein, partial [Planctomycetota bacterium]|nr:5'-nucleotidase C-terminal domain-containing protein [Planctomycetota bacterium]
FEKGGLKVGVIGLVTDDLPRLASAETLAGLKILSLEEAARPLAEKLKKECDLVVVLAHEGHEEDRKLARAVPQIDVIVGGHDHKRLTTPETEGNCLILDAGCNGREYGRLDLVVDAGKVVSWKGGLHPAEAEGVTANALMAEPLARIEKRIDELEHEVLGETTRALSRGNYYQETACGSFVAEALKEAAKVDVGLMNSGGIRSDFPKGKVTRADLLKVMPNDSKIRAFEVTGAELEAICLFNANAAIKQDHGVLQVAGLRYRWKREKTDPEGRTMTARLLKLEVGGKPLDPAKTYTCASGEFIVDAQAVKYFGFAPKKVWSVEPTIHEALVAAFKRGPIEQPDRGRMWEEREPKERPAHSGKAEPGEKGDKGEKAEKGEKEPVPAGAGGEKGEMPKGGGSDDDGE